MVYRCFDNRWNYIRLNKKQETEGAISKCKELLKYKKDKSAYEAYKARRDTVRREK